jgi:hypothetical protein
VSVAGLNEWTPTGTLDLVLGDCCRYLAPPYKDWIADVIAKRVEPGPCGSQRHVVTICIRASGKQIDIDEAHLGEFLRVIRT